MEGFSTEVIAQKSRSICNAILAEGSWLNACCVALFAAHSGEPFVEELLALAPDKRFCFPRVRDLDVDFFHVSDPAALLVSRWGLREPSFEPARLVPLEEVDIILVPGIAFTRAGQRLGRGGGYYDRLLAAPALRALKIGVCFQSQFVEVLPCEAHDVSMDVVIAEVTGLGAWG